MNRTETMYDIDYQRLGDYIREVNVRNRELRVTKPMGINIDKHFMPSVANIIGTDLSAYKLVCKNQFACNLMHVGRDEKIPMAMWNDANPIIGSPAYFVFEITKTEDLLPEYLMMWFRRAEFDRNAWFYTDADVRGGMNKDALLDMRLPIPTLARQREIVSEYETLTRRIRLNEQMIAKLEETAQALYRKTFVDNIDKQNLPLFDIADITYGFPFNSELFCDDNTLFPIIRIRDILSNKTETFTSEQVDKKYEINDGDILVGMDGAFHMTIWSGGYALQNQRIVKIVPKKGKYVSAYQIFYSIYDAIKQLESSIEGTTVAHLSDKDMRKLSIIVASTKIQEKTYSLFETLNRSVITYKKENLKLNELQSLLLARMGKE